MGDREVGVRQGLVEVPAHDARREVFEQLRGRVPAVADPSLFEDALVTPVRCSGRSRRRLAARSAAEAVASGTRRSRGGLLGRCGSLWPCLSSSGAMPRRPPAVVRAALARHLRRRDQPFSVVDGASAGTLREIRSWELSRGRPGEVARDLAWWGRQANEMSSRHWHGSDAGFYYYGYFGCPCCDDDPPRGRWGLEEVLQVLSRRARREMAAVVGALDARVLAMTYGSEPSAPGWWESRI